MKRKPNASSFIRRSRGQVSGSMLIAGLAVLLLVLVALYLFWPEPAVQPVPAPAQAPGQPLETVAPAQSGEERGDTAREIIARLRAAPDGPDYAEAYARAGEFQAAGQLADAQLLLFFAARGGYGPAAFDLATLNDPSRQADATGLVSEADAFQAYRWYIAARDAGHDNASERLEALYAWAESASQSGDPDAERLLLQWEQAQ